MRLAAAIFVAIQLSATVSAATLRGRVVSISDGDTLTVVDSRNQQYRVRLSGIDAPESGQSFGRISKYNLSSLVAGRSVTVDYHKFDRYGRLVGKVTLAELDINLQQIRSGLAWVYTDFEAELSSDDANAYRAAEREARKGLRGLWADADPKAPWVFRRSARARDQVESRPLLDTSTAQIEKSVIANRRSHVFHRPDCPDYLKVAPHNRVTFASVSEAEKAGYRQAKNCP